MEEERARDRSARAVRARDTGAGSVDCWWERWRVCQKQRDHVRYPPLFPSRLAQQYMAIVARTHALQTHAARGGGESTGAHALRKTPRTLRSATRLDARAAAPRTAAAALPSMRGDGRDGGCACGVAGTREGGRREKRWPPTNESDLKTRDERELRLLFCGWPGINRCPPACGHTQRAPINPHTRQCTPSNTHAPQCALRRTAAAHPAARPFPPPGDTPRAYHAPPAPTRPPRLTTRGGELRPIEPPSSGQLPNPRCTRSL